MILGNRDLGSFRDPSGHIYEADGKIYRTVSESAMHECSRLKERRFYDELASTGYAITSKELNISDFSNLPAGTAMLFEHEKIPFISYPYEWGFLQLKAAALLHLDLQLFSLERDVVLKDSSSYNVQFIGAKPVFIDFLSFRPYRDGEYWDGHSQFCEQFLNPLLLRAKFGVPHNSWYRGNMEGVATSDISQLLSFRQKLSWNVFSQIVLPNYLQNRAINMNTDELTRAKEKPLPKNGYRNLLLQLREWVASLATADKYSTTWAGYHDNNTYTDDEAGKKRKFIGSFAQKVKPSLMWDLGCNTGQYSAVALREGAGMSVGFDFDQQALDTAFSFASDKKVSLLPLFLDAANPSPGQGWGNEERKSLAKRAKADGVISLAFIHHLAIGKNIPLDWVVDWIVGLAPNGIIEFVHKNDPTVRKMLSLREDIYTEYCEETFRQLLERRAKIVQTEVISEHGRTLYWYARNAEKGN